MDTDNHLELPPQLLELIELHARSRPGCSRVDVIEQALDALSEKSKGVLARHRSEKLVERFQRFRGMAKGWSLERLRTERSDGLA